MLSLVLLILCSSLAGRIGILSSLLLRCRSLTAILWCGLLKVTSDLLSSSYLFILLLSGIWMGALSKEVAIELIEAIVQEHVSYGL